MRNDVILWRYIAKEYPANSLNLVSDYYGPGTLALWVLTAAGVGISWFTLKKHEINPEFVGFLLYPIIAGGHAIIQVAKFTGSREDIWSTADPELLPQALSIQASVKVCNLFFFLGTTLSLIAILDNILEHFKDDYIPIAPLYNRRLACLGVVAVWCSTATAVGAFFGGGLGKWLLYHLMLWFFPFSDVLLNPKVRFICLLVLMTWCILTPIQDRWQRGGWKRVWLLLALFFCGQLLNSTLLFIYWDLLIMTIVQFREMFLPMSAANLVDLDQATAFISGIVFLGYTLQRELWRILKVRKDTAGAAGAYPV